MLRGFLDSLRVRVRVPVLDRAVPVGPVRRRPAEGAAALRQDHGSDAAVAARGARRHLFARSCRSRPKTGRVLQVPITETRYRRRHHHLQDEDGSDVETPVTGGRCKLQWKPDWGMRWHALGVDYEMSGKDLIASVDLAGKICRILGSRRRKASTTSCSWTRRARRSPSPRATASVGRGMADLRAAGEPGAVHVPEAARGQAALFRRDPARGRRLPDLRRQVPDGGAGAAAGEPGLAHPQRPAAAAARATSATASCSTSPASPTRRRRRAVGLHHALRAGGDAAERAVPRQAGRLRDQLLPRLREADEAVPRAQRDRAQGAGRAAARISSSAPADADAETLQTEVYEIGKRHPFPELRAWFKALYEVLLGQDQGPRFGSFIALYGRKETAALIRKALASPTGLAAE